MSEKLPYVGIASVSSELLEQLGMGESDVDELKRMLAEKFEVVEDLRVEPEET